MQVKVLGQLMKITEVDILSMASALQVHLQGLANTL